MDKREQNAYDITDEETLVSGDLRVPAKLVAASAEEMETDGSHDGCLREQFPY